MLKLMGKKKLRFYAEKLCLSKPMVSMELKEILQNECTGSSGPLELDMKLAKAK